MKKIVIGTLAHVDAGKTTLNESLLYQSGNLRKLGRVDHKDAFLDYNEQERDRGITIYNKEARFTHLDTSFTIIDTPGHIDFSTEMERALKALDYAIIVISGVDGLQAHTKTIWKLLKHYHIPAFIFVNKMDISHQFKEDLLREIQVNLHENCLDLTDENSYEQIALCDETILQTYLETNTISKSDLQTLIKSRQVFPVYFGSALKLQGIDELLNALDTYTLANNYPNEFGGIVYKISKDDKGSKLVHLKVTGGSLLAKSLLDNGDKIDQIRLYSGSKYEMVNEVMAGDVCCLKGLDNTKITDSFGHEQNINSPMISSYMSYRVVVLDNVDCFKAYQLLKELQEEDPELHLTYNKNTDEIRIQLMGDVQHEILQRRIKDQFKLNVTFDYGKIAYKETITNKIEGVGHYEPLRHYAEAHIIIESLPLGSGVQIKSNCSTDDLARNYQHQILSILETSELVGVLTGSPITDVKLTLVSGKAHDKHTEGGDFYQATHRAIRHGLMLATSQLLEPYYSFEIKINSEFNSRVIFDLDSMNADFSVTEEPNNELLITGFAPIRLMQGYQSKLAALTKGTGYFSCNFKGYEPCVDAETIIKEINYDPQSDIEHPIGSVFCKQGAGYHVPYNEVYDHMHLPLTFDIRPKKEAPKPQGNRYKVSEAELQRVIERTFGPNKTKLHHLSTPKHHQDDPVHIAAVSKPCLIVDGYNVIHAWDELKELAAIDLYNARVKLIDYMKNYQGFKNNLLIIVFDAYKVKESPGTIDKDNNIYIVYTKESETADTYIERTVHELGKHYNISVATSDGLEQLIILGQGAKRISARELILDYEHLQNDFRKQHSKELTKTYNMALADIRNFENQE